MAQKLTNPFTRNVSFRPASLSSNPHIYESQVTPVMPTSSYSQKYSLNSYNYSNPYSNNYSNNYTHTNNTNAGYKNSTQAYPKYSPKKYDDSNLNSLEDKNPFRRTSLLNNNYNNYKGETQTKAYNAPSSSWRDTTQKVYIPQKIQNIYNDKSDTASVYTYINKINDLDDGRSNYGESNPFNRKSLLKGQSKSRENLRLDSERDYERNHTQVETGYRDYDHLIYKPEPYKNETGYDVYPRSSKNFQEVKYMQPEKDYGNKSPYNNFENVEEYDGNRYKNKSYDMPALNTQNKYSKYDRESENRYDKQLYNQTQTYNKYENKEQDKYDKYENKYSNNYNQYDNQYGNEYANNYGNHNYGKEEPYDQYDLNQYTKNKDQSYEHQQRYPQKSKKIPNHSDQYEYKKNPYQIQIEHEKEYNFNDKQSFKSQEEFGQPKFGVKTATKPQYEEDLYKKYNHSPEFRHQSSEGYQKSKKIIKFQEDDEEEEEEYKRPTFDSSAPSTVEIRGKIYHQIKLSA